MKKSFKSIIATTLAGIMLFGSVPAATLAGINLPALDFASVKASAASDEYTDTTIGLKFTVNDKVSITGYTNNIAVDSQGTFKIPTKLTNSNTGISYTVTSI